MKAPFKNLLFLAILLAGFLGCRKNTNLPAGLITVQYNHCSEKILNAYICFDSVITDSRCPEGAECIWQGEAIIAVTFHESGNQHSFRMSLAGYTSHGPVSDTTINHYRIRFVDLKPYPKISSSPKTEPFRAIFKITR